MFLLVLFNNFYSNGINLNGRTMVAELKGCETRKNCVLAPILREHGFIIVVIAVIFKMIINGADHLCFPRFTPRKKTLKTP